MPIYIYKGNSQISTNAIRNNKVVKAIYAKEQGQGTVCVWGIDNVIMFTYTVTNNKITITGLVQNKEPTSLIIPAQIEGLAVTAIAPNAFKDKNKIKEVVIPNSVTSIGNSAFSGCSSLENITIPFVGASTTANNGYDQVFGYIFGYTTTKYQTDDVPGATNQYYDNTKYYWYYIPSSIKSVTITGGIIPSYAFRNCSGLTSITIPNSVTNIGERAFSYCTGLTSITIPNSVTNIGHSAFDGCTGLTSVYYAGDIASWCGISGLSHLMGYGSSSKTLYIGGNKVEGKLTIPDSVTSISSNAFAGCTGLTSITIPNSVTNIGWYAFSGCTGLASVTIPDSVTSIGEYAFESCTGLTRVTIGNSVTSIGERAFESCTGLTRVTIGNSVTSIGERAFRYCYKLIEVYNRSTLSITAGSESNGHVAYYAKNVYTNEGGSKLTTDKNGYVVYTESSQKILVAYHGTNTKLILPSGITEINQYAFYNSTGFTSVTIPNSVTSIGSNAFTGCNVLTNITGPATSVGTVAKQAEPTSFTVNITSGTSIGEYAFSYLTGLTSVIIGSSVTSISKGAFSGCTGLTSITIPNSVTSIGNDVFRNCTRLTSITFNGTIAKWNAISKGTDWNNNTGNYTIHCTDGDIPK